VPQIEEVQFVWWGPFRPDTIPMAVDGINVATGPNGAGKTAFLDAIKLLLGTDHLKAKPNEYIYVSGTSTDPGDNGDGEPAHRAKRALLRAVFANPDRGRGLGRVFSDAGRGCESAAYVTAICEVTRDKRRYVLVPGRIAWGSPGRDVDDDISRLQTIPNSHWLGPGKWQGLMERAGISRSLVQLMSMGQGETDKAIHGTPEALLRRALELTGRQEIIDSFRETKKGLQSARVAHTQAIERFVGEERGLALLETKVERHLEYREDRRRAQRIEQLELPVASHRAASAHLVKVRGEREGTARNVETLRASVAALDEQIPNLEQRLRAHDGQTAGLRDHAEAARQRLRAAASVHGALDHEHRQVISALHTAATHDDGVLDDDLIDMAQQQADAAVAHAQRIRDDIDTNQHEVDELAAGRPVLPDGLDAFRHLLAERGIAAELIAEQLDADQTTAAEAALHDGVWTLVVASSDFDTAIALAVEHGHRLPVAMAGDGRPSGALAGARGVPAAGAYLEEISLPIDQTPGVRGDGLVHGRHWAAWRRPERPILGEQARRAALEAAEARLAGLRAQLPDAERARHDARERVAALRAGLMAARRLPALDEELVAAAAEQERADADVRALEAQLSGHSETRGRLDSELTTMRVRHKTDSEQLRQSIGRLATYEQQVAEAETAIEPLTDEQQAVEDVPSEDALQLELDRLRRNLDDDVRYPPELRSELILAERDAHAQRVEEIGGLLKGRERDLRAVLEEVERARERYTQHIRQVIDLVGQRFRALCDRAGMEGNLQLVPSAEIEGEMGLDLKVAHVRGERMLSSRHPHHSGGQRVKIAILLLLASMGVEGATDLLIMDEHSAHLDSRNIDHVAELMNQLKGQVQFILAMPSHAEALRLSWCDHQLAFYLRASQELFAPPIKLLTRLPDDGDAKYLHRMGQLPLAN
jgi:chromosome segregation ATPase